MDSSPAFSTDLLGALFSIDGPAGLPGALGQGVSQRGPPGEVTSHPFGLHPGIAPFADLLSGVVLPSNGGLPLPSGGKVLPDARRLPLRLPILPPPAAAPAVSEAPAPTNLGPTNVAETLPLTTPPDDGVGPLPPTRPLPPAPASRAEPAPAAQHLDPGHHPIPVRVDVAAYPRAPAPETRRPVPLAEAPQGRLPDRTGPGSASTPQVPLVDWNLTERPIKLHAQQPPPDMPASELARELNAIARPPTTAGVLPEPGSAAAFGLPTSTPVSPAAPAGESPGALPTPFTGAPLATVDAPSLAGRVHWMIDNAVGEARLKLNPPELGALDIKISMVDDKAFVQLAATQLGATELLEAALPRLRELLNVGGLELAGATVSHEGTQRGAPEHPAGEAHWESVEGEAEETATPMRSRPDLGQIDVYA